ncbi:methyl-accepting chemotaxis protein [Vibrio marisflavi]|uniref:Methyl-accepting chemotaxis protein n=1 Tax=Vibrio marisflavi CECT 7928 TaxID=634439 RepID=A0ABM9A813_9VIBR|nr:methyl-accepting chemotaxis protein [Vibrio marisflavi]CAH0540855.1 hypothetical protein VMF7928_03174 [Vibrio marisflavi CECT 7928]
MHISLKNLSIRKQILVPVAITTIALIIALWVTDSELEHQQSKVEVNIQSLMYYKDSLAEIGDQIYPLRINAVYAIYDSSRRQAFLSKLGTTMEKVNDVLSDMASRKTFAKPVRKVQTAVDSYREYSQQAADVFTRHDNGSLSEQEYQQFVSNYRDAGNAMVNSLQQLSDKVNEFADVAVAQTAQEGQNVRNKAMMVIVAVLTVSLLIAWLISGYIVTPIKKLQEMMRELAKGNLSVRAEVESDNEIGMLANDVNTTSDRLHTTVEQLIAISEEVASASIQLVSVMKQSEKNAQKELIEIEQVASAVNELACTANNVSDNALQADSIARDTDALTNSGRAIFEENNEASAKMSVAIDSAAQVIGQLKEQSEEINKAVEVIDGVSDQTNLLALNAAIEAARAGEYGRGFAVVATEVRTLAAKAQESTVEIQQVIDALQTQAGRANDGMHESLDLLTHNQELSSQMSSVLTSISEAVTNITDSNAQVATAAEEQSQVTQDINRNVSNISSLVNENVAGISQSATASAQLSELAEKQKAQLAFFKL